MHVREVYTIAIGSLFVVFLAWQLAVVGDVLRRRGVRLFRKVFLQTLLVKRRKGSSNYTVGTGFIIASLCTGNIIALCVRVKNVSDIADRLRGLLHVNLIPLFLSVRTPLLSELFFGLTFQPHSLLHRLLGWICVAEGLGYTILSLLIRQWSTLSTKFGVRSNVVGLYWRATTNSDQITLAMTLIVVTSILYLRRIFFETFLKLHMLLGVALVICLWLEASLSLRDFHTVCLTIMTSLWSLEKSIWLGQTALNRYRGSDQISISPSLADTSNSDATLVQINLRRPRKIKYGQYVFITVPSLPHTIIGRFQSHPYMVAWSDTDSTGLSRTLTLLIAHRNGFSKTISRCKPGTRCSLDGPYGALRRLEDFDKVLFVASGVGVATHLLAIRHLLNAHRDQTSRVRRLSLLWFVETEGELSKAFHSPFYKN